MEAKGLKQQYRIYLVLGIMCFGLSTVLSDGESTGDIMEWIAFACVIAGFGLVITGLLVMKREGHVFFDERFVLHRLKATRFALILGMGAILILMIRSQVTEGAMRWDLLFILASIAVGKISAMVYYTHTG